MSPLNTRFETKTPFNSLVSSVCLDNSDYLDDSNEINTFFGELNIGKIAGTVFKDIDNHATNQSSTRPSIEDAGPIIFSKSKQKIKSEKEKARQNQNTQGNKPLIAAVNTLQNKAPKDKEYYNPYNPKLGSPQFAFLGEIDLSNMIKSEDFVSNAQVQVANQIINILTDKRLNNCTENFITSYGKEENTELIIEYYLPKDENALKIKEKRIRENNQAWQNNTSRPVMLKDCSINDFIDAYQRLMYMNPPFQSCKNKYLELVDENIPIPEEYFYSSWHMDSQWLVFHLMKNSKDVDLAAQLIGVVIGPFMVGSANNDETISSMKVFERICQRLYKKHTSKLGI